MEKIKGEIIEVETQMGETNGKAWERVTYTLDNKKKYSTFDKNMLDFIKGDYVEMDVEQKGKYANVTAIRKIAPETPTKAQESRKVRTSMEISATELTKLAIELHKGSPHTIEKCGADIWQLYTQFLQWLDG